MKLSIAQRLYLGLTVGYLIVVTVGILSYRSYQKQVLQGEWVQLTQEVIKTSTCVKQLVTQLEATKRSLFVTENPDYVQAFDTTAQNLTNMLNHLSVLVKHNPDARLHVSKVEKATTDLADYWRQTPNVATLDAATFRETIRVGNQLMMTFNQEIEKFEQYENRLLAERNERSEQSSQQAITTLFSGLALILIIVSILSYQVYHELIARVKSQRQLKKNLKEMETLNAETSQQNWQLSSLSSINNLLQGKYYDDATKLADACTQALAGLLRIPSAILYRYQENEQILVPIGKFAPPSKLPEFHRFGVGITGQAAQSREISVINNIPEGDIVLQAGIGSIQPRSLVLVPLWVDDQLIGLLELIGFTEFTPLQLQLLNLLTHNMASALQSVMIREHLEALVSQISEQKEELESTQQVLTKQAVALEQSSRYKSDFLANMSHELRTPLNSILILANLLAENKEGHLTEKQREYSHIIHKSGSDLLHLINDILDLSKIESGKIDLYPEEVPVSSLLSDMDELFRHVAEERQIRFKVTNHADSEQLIYTDKKRVEQILKNLLSNGLKFTPADGEVALTVLEGETKDQLAFVVKDTGVGIAKEYQTAIFEAFQQVDGSTNRKYGGTGLGLSISKHLAQQLGGTLTLSSTLGEGSEFTLFLPVTGPSVPLRLPTQTHTSPPEVITEVLAIQQRIVDDDRHIVTPQTPVLLIIEDDVNFATILRDFARRKNYLSIVALTGEEGLYCARKYKPSAILLDIHLPGLSGTEILSTLRQTPELAKIPVHVITSHDDFGYLAGENTGMTIKPFEIDELYSIFEKLGCQGQQNIRPSSPAPQPELVTTEIASVPDADKVSDVRLDGFKILLTDDDMRNVYALTAMLETHGAEVVTASNGKEALEQLATDPAIQLVLMDIMMPVMDGYETLREIRKKPIWAHIPIIAISAKAMEGDRQKAIDAGASDYLTKPISRNLLLTLTHKWLARAAG